MTDFLIAGPNGADVTLLLAPGAGAPMTSPWMEGITGLLVAGGIRVVRFDFEYMAARQRTGARRPPPKAEALMSEYEVAVRQLAAEGRGGSRLLIGGKSLGGRVASLVAERLFESGEIAGLVCLGYPFHPPGKPEALRTRHLVGLTCPMLIVQGERDPFGGVEEVAGYGLSAITFHWAVDGDHDLAPRRRSGETAESNLAAAARAVVRFAEGLASAPRSG